MVEQHPPPAPGGRRIKLRYMTQVKARPPGFVVMCSHPDKMPESYTRYLVGGLRTDFDMPGTPIRLHLRSQSALVAAAEGLPAGLDVRYYFYSWRNDGLLTVINRELVAVARQARGRDADPRPV